MAFLMTAVVCGCKNEPQNSSGDTVETIVEEVVVDENGNPISNSQQSAVSNENTADDTNTDDNNSEAGTENTKNEINIDYEKVVEVDICDDIVRGYLNAGNNSDQYFWLSNYTSTGARYDKQNLSLDWAVDLSAEYTVYFSENADFSNPVTVKTTVSRDLSAATLIPGKTYYWKVLGEVSDQVLGGGRIKVNNAPARWIYVDGIKNVRDMGGWKTEGGKTVKYGMLYRGAQLNSEKNGEIVNVISEKGIETFKSLGIKTEFDLRAESNVHIPPAKMQINHVFIGNHTSYSNIFSKNVKDTVVSNYKQIFNYLSESSNYPIYAHCQGGADRTGTYAFLLNGLLGVKYEDLIRDFELTSFAGTMRWRSAGFGDTFNDTDEDYVDGEMTIRWRALYNGMMDYGKENGCATLSEAIEHWFINYIGIPKSQIDSFKSIMLE